MNLADFVDLKLLQTIQDNFSDATGLAAIAVNAQGEYITKGSNFTDFCMKYTRKSQEGARRCIKCDNECTGTYFCHAGLMDFASDIVVEGEKVGAIIGGQVLPKEPDLEKFRAIARELGIREEDYIQALKKVPIRSEKQIRAAANMLGSIVNQLVNLEYIKKRSAKKIEVFDSEIGTCVSAANQMKQMLRGLEQVATMEKILSINASVEAGRAGAAGAGFTVVAREIGQLSQNASKTYTELYSLTAQIEQSIRRIQGVQL